MTKRIGLALALVFGTSAAASGQASITATASVAQVAAETGTERDVIFPQGTPGGSGGSSVTATATAANASGPQLGFVEYRLNYSGPAVTVVAPATLADASLNTIGVTFGCGEADASGTALVLGACGVHALTYSGPGLKTRRVWVGGDITQAAIDGAVPGTYSGTITMTLAP